MSFKKILLAGGIASLALTGFANSSLAEDNPWYVQLGVGLSTEVDKTDVNFGGAAKSTFDFKDSGSYGIGFGYDSGAWRTQFDYKKITTELDEVMITGLTSPTDITGDVDVSAYTISLFRDFNNDGKLQPYIGVGVGKSFVYVGVPNLSFTIYNLLFFLVI